MSIISLELLKLIFKEKKETKKESTKEKNRVTV